MTASLGHYPKYMSQPLRPPEEMRADILALERETEGLLAEIVSDRRLRSAVASRQSRTGSKLHRETEWHSWLATADRRSNEVVCTRVVLR